MDDIYNIIYRYYPHKFLIFVDNRERREIVFCEDLCHILLIVCGIHAHKVGCHYFLYRCIRTCKKKVFQTHNADQESFPVNYIGVVYCFLVKTDVSYCLYGFFCRTILI